GDLVLDLDGHLVVEHRQRRQVLLLWDQQPVRVRLADSKQKHSQDGKKVFHVNPFREEVPDLRPSGLAQRMRSLRRPPSRRDRASESCLVGFCSDGSTKIQRRAYLVGSEHFFLQAPPLFRYLYLQPRRTNLL